MARLRLFELTFIWALLIVDGLTTERFSSPVRSSSTTSRLLVRRSRPFEDYQEPHEHDEITRQRSTDRPTCTSTQTVVPPVVPSKPKIVVLGASGKIGRLVVRQLLESSLDATIVAFVRDYDKACRVLYDDLLVSNRDSKKKGPKLQIVKGDLVPADELPGYLDEEEASWMERAQSAAKFYGTKAQDYDNRKDSEPTDSNEALHEAIKDCTTIISCVGSVRPTNFWTDFIARPLWRLFRKDVSKWCKDPRHPFYVHYSSTRKALCYAEKEQLRREAAVAAMNEVNDKEEVVPRIRFVRISDLCVAQRPWNFVPILTNIMHSMVFRYQDMTERLLENSALVETVLLRPGDLVDEERDVNTTSLQVNPSGWVPSPSRVGREDVAALAVSAALFNSQPDKKTEDGEKRTLDEPFHYTLAVRWAGADLSPYPPQGSMNHGLPDANLCMHSALRTLRREGKRKRRLKMRKAKAYQEPVLQFAQRIQASRHHKNLKPYGVCVAVPVYMFLTMLAKTLLQSVVPYMPGRSWMMPALARAGELVAMVGAFVVGHLSLLHGRLPPLLQRIPLRQAAQKYISF